MLVGFCAIADAQPLLSSQTSFNPQLFHPAPGSTDAFVTVESARTLEHLQLATGLTVDYARAPLEVLTYSSRDMDPYGARVRAQAHAFGGELWIALGLGRRAQLALSLPSTLYQTGDRFDGDYPPPDGVHIRAVSGAALGDPRVYLKVRLFGHDAGWAIALSHWLSIPVGSDDRFGGEPHFRGFLGEPRLISEWVRGRFRVGLGVGFRWRVASSSFYTVTTGHALTYFSAFAVNVVKRLTLIAELYGHHDFSDRADYTAASPLELDVSARTPLGAGFSLFGGVGTGVIPGAGTPWPRVFLGLTFANAIKDRDGDGIVDPRDRCPTTPEDRDGFEDADGCPDLDDDNDGIPDRLDACPRAREDFDQFEDKDGCPDLDNDKDGIDDLHDGCPDAPEDGKAPEPRDGCPASSEADADGDSIPDALDKCPSEPEDKDGFEDEDGCIDPDNDRDGVPDDYDECPDRAEDLDGVKDSDGCPE